MIKVKIGDREYQIDHHNGATKLDGKLIDWDLEKLSDHEYHIIYGGKSYQVLIEEEDTNAKEIRLRVNGEIVNAHAAGKLDILLAEMGIDAGTDNSIQTIQAPMPGKIAEVMVRPGDEVTGGTPLLILEAMKMENVIKSPTDGIVDQVEIAAGDSVEKNQLLISFRA